MSSTGEVSKLGPVEYGFDAPLMSSSPFSSALEEATAHHSNSFVGSGVSAALNEIAAFLGDGIGSGSYELNSNSSSSNVWNQSFASYGTRTPFSSALEEPTAHHSNSDIHGSSSVSAALNEITAFLGDGIGSSSYELNSNSSSSNVWNQSFASYGARSSDRNGALKQTICYLQLLQEIQDNTPGDPNQRNRICALATSLQQHLMFQYTSPGVSARPVALHDNLERVAKYHREVAGLTDARVTWSGNLPPRSYRNPVYSCKVFLGGVPWDITEGALLQSFRMFGNARIEWPGKDGNQPKGYAYVIFDSDKQVKNLLQNCTHDYVKSADYFKLSSRRTRSKDVQVIPWALSDSNFVRCTSTKLDPQKTVFVGALHGMLNAEGLCLIMQELFDGVVYAGIDTDKNKYPIGSGRVTFNNSKSYMKAVSAAFIEIRTSKFKKKFQVDPYLDDATCSVCTLQQGPYFCRDLRCFNYFCRTCFQLKHGDEEYRSHRPLMRNTNKHHGGPVSIMPTNFSAELTCIPKTFCANGNGNQRLYNL